MDEKMKLVTELIKAMQPEPEPATVAPVSLPKMRTIPKAVQEIKSSDPDSAITVTALRRAVKRGCIPAVMVESKVLVNLASVYDYLSGQQLTNDENSKGKIRKVGA